MSSIARGRWGAGLVVPELCIDVREIDRVVEQTMDRVRPGRELSREIRRQEARIGIDLLVAGHGLRAQRGGTASDR